MMRQRQTPPPTQQQQRPRLSVVAVLLLCSCYYAAAFSPQQTTQSTLPFSIRRQPLTTAPSLSKPSCQAQDSPLFRKSTSLSAAAPIGAIAGAISGGIFAGGLHAIAGPDHLAALLPRCIGQRWYRAGRIGAVWGMGHGISATILGVLAYGLKSKVQQVPALKAALVSASHVTDIAVGLSLVLIGVLGIKEAREWEEEQSSQPQNSLSAAATEAGPTASVQKRAVLFNGLLHGFSWDGAPSLAPALAVATWSGNLAFLSAYAAGTVGAMAVTTTLIGEGTRRAGQMFHRPDLPQKLSLYTSLLAIGIGLFWCVLALR